MEDLMDELLNEFKCMSLESDKTKINTFIQNVTTTNNNFDIVDEDITSLISEFSNLEMSQRPKLVHKFYTFIIKCINRDRRYVSSSLFIPPEPPMCR
jgi:hypothetical protein